MGHTKGYRRGSRYMFARDFGKHGTIPLSVYLRTYKIGDSVDIRGNGAIQKSLPHSYYHGKTGKVFNVTQHAVGIIVNKRVRTRIIPKRIHVRIEHVKRSTARDEFVKRVKHNDELKRAAKAQGKTIVTKRLPVGPRPGHLVKLTEATEYRPIPYEILA